MADDVLKSFLVAIGYKEDEASKRRFIDGLAKAEKAVASLSLALAAAATAATAAAVKMAASFEDLFYASQRTGASINNLRGLAYAVSQLGGSYGGAVQSLEAFAKNVRTNPGYESMARKLGVATRENGKLRDTVDILTDLGKVFKGQRYEVAYQYATALGLDERTFQLLRDQPDALRRYRDEYERTTKALGTNTKEMTEQGKALSQSWRSFLSTMEAVSERVAATFFPVITKLLDYMREWVVAHGPQINAFWTQVGKGIEVVERAAKSAYDTVEPFVSLFTKKLADGFNASGGMVGLLRDLKQLFSDLGDMVKRAYEYIVKLIQLVGLDKVAAALGAGIKSGFRESDWTGGGMPDWSGGGGGGGIPPGATGRGALEPFRRGFFGRLRDRVMGSRPSMRRGYQPGAQGGDGGTPAQPGATPPGSDAGNLTDLINREAAAAGIDPRIMHGIRAGESGHRHNRGNPRAAYDHNPGNAGVPEDSWGPFQLNRLRGLGQTFQRETGLDLSDPRTIPAQTRWVARYIAAQRRRNPNYSPYPTWQGFHGLRNADPRWGDSGYVPEAPAAPAQGNREAPTSERRPVGQATRVSDAEVIANDHGHFARVNRALGNMDFSARHGASEAPLGVTNNTTNSTNRSVTMPMSVTMNIQGGSNPQDTANATVGGLTRFQEMSMRNAQGAVR